MTNERIQFTARVSSGGMINIPQNVEDMNDFEHEDLLQLEVVKHKKKDGETAYQRDAPKVDT